MDNDQIMKRIMKDTSSGDKMDGWGVRGDEISENKELLIGC